MAVEEVADSQLIRSRERSLVWYLTGRTAVITLLLGGAAFFYLQGNLGQSAIPLFFFLAVAYAEALVVALLLRRVHRVVSLTHAQIIWDLLFVTLLILLTGAVESVFSFAYLLVIIGASFLLSRRLTIIAAATAAILFGSLLVVQFYQWFPLLKLERAMADAAFFNAIFVHYVAFFLTAVLSGTLAERWRRSEALLERKSIDYAELERMNRTILAHINSGVMLVNPAGRIRSFNRAAADISGLSLHEVYDRLLDEIFPDLIPDGVRLAHPVSRAEGPYVHPAGRELVLGYATTFARDNRGGDLGTLVTFQDLTELKRIENQLKQSDRLAAIGRLSAGLAHEIRNPLASISGSAQLILENSHLEADDQRLLGIVVKEAERLNGLLSDFLSFAKPQPPVRSTFDFAELVQELEQILQRDSRFADIRITTEVPRPCLVTLDRQQIWQALWDLSINAAEALEETPPPKELRLVARSNQPFSFWVEDNGPGVADDHKERIFEPFFSSKSRGTGLGLATVFAIADAHRGRVSVTDSPLGGARFVLDFPQDEKDQR